MYHDLSAEIDEVRRS